MAEPRLRSYRPSDRAAVLFAVEKVLREHGLWGSHKSQLGDLEAPEKFYSDFLVVEAAGRVVGCGALSAEGFIQRMYLLKKWRGKGLGRAVLQALIAHAKKRRMKRLRLETAPRLKAAIGLYERAGFSQVATGSDCCSVKMALELPK